AGSSDSLCQTSRASTPHALLSASCMSRSSFEPGNWITANIAGADLLSSLGQPEVAADSGQRRLDVRLEGAAGDALEALDVAARRLAAHLVGQRRGRPVAAVALLGQPAAHVLLVEGLGIAAFRERPLVAVQVPVPRGVRRVDLVH